MKFELVKSESIATFGISLEDGVIIIDFFKWQRWIETDKLYNWFREDDMDWHRLK